MQLQQIKQEKPIKTWIHESLIDKGALSPGMNSYEGLPSVQ